MERDDSTNPTDSDDLNLVNDIEDTFLLQGGQIQIQNVMSLDKEKMDYDLGSEGFLSSSITIGNSEYKEVSETFEKIDQLASQLSPTDDIPAIENENEDGFASSTLTGPYLFPEEGAQTRLSVHANTHDHTDPSVYPSGDALIAFSESGNTINTTGTVTNFPEEIATSSNDTSVNSDDLDFRETGNVVDNGGECMDRPPGSPVNCLETVQDDVLESCDTAEPSVCIPLSSTTLSLLDMKKSETGQLESDGDAAEWDFPTTSKEPLLESVAAGKPASSMVVPSGENSPDEIPNEACSPAVDILPVSVDHEPPLDVSKKPIPLSVAEEKITPVPGTPTTVSSPLSMSHSPRVTETQDCSVAHENITCSPELPCTISNTEQVIEFGNMTSSEPGAGHDSMVGPKCEVTLEVESQINEEIADYGIDTYAERREDEYPLIPEVEGDESMPRFNLRKRVSSQAFSPDSDSGAGRRQRPYSDKSVTLALEMVESGEMSLQEASRVFDIPRTSLYKFLQLQQKSENFSDIPDTGEEDQVKVNEEPPPKHKEPHYSEKSRTVPSKMEEEKEMVAVVNKMASTGKKISQKELAFIVHYLMSRKSTNVFKHVPLPTLKWTAKFISRHPELNRRGGKNIKITREEVTEWQNEIKRHMEKLWNIEADEFFAPENVARIFNCCSVKMDINGIDVRTGEMIPNNVKKTYRKEEVRLEDITNIIVGISASGIIYPPVLIIPSVGDELPEHCIPKSCVVIANTMSRITTEIFLKWVQKFNEDIIQRNIKKPVLLFISDKPEQAHLSVMEYCWNNNIIVLCLPPRSNKTLPPFEVGLWPRVKSEYCEVWKRSGKDFNHKVSCYEFPSLFMKAWDAAKHSSLAAGGFSGAGIIPLDMARLCGSEVSEVGSSVHIQRDNLPKSEGNNQVSQEESAEAKQEVKDPEAMEQKTEREPYFSETLGDPLEGSQEERTKGRVEGIEQCLRQIESFIPRDVIPVWSQRGPEYRGRCELAFKMWRSVSLLLKATCAMVSLEQLQLNQLFPQKSASSSFYKAASPDKRPPDAMNDGYPMDEYSTLGQLYTMKRKYSTGMQGYLQGNNTDDEFSNKRLKTAGYADMSRPLVTIYDNSYINGSAGIP